MHCTVKTGYSGRVQSTGISKKRTGFSMFMIGFPDQLPFCDHFPSDVNYTNSDNYPTTSALLVCLTITMLTDK